MGNKPYGRSGYFKRPGPEAPKENPDKFLPDRSQSYKDTREIKPMEPELKRKVENRIKPQTKLIVTALAGGKLTSSELWEQVSQAFSSRDEFTLLLPALEFKKLIKSEDSEKGKLYFLP